MTWPLNGSSTLARSIALARPVWLLEPLRTVRRQPQGAGDLRAQRSASRVRPDAEPTPLLVVDHRTPPGMLQGPCRWPRNLHPRGHAQHIRCGARQQRNRGRSQNLIDRLAVSNQPSLLKFRAEIAFQLRGRTTTDRALLSYQLSPSASATATKNRYSANASALRPPTT